ncbi:MAG: hypothetical protein KAU14_01090, partial [Thermoplasmata archaeon]|nr:hypothetical protein [Thermoplasmata archaeon]
MEPEEECEGEEDYREGRHDSIIRGLDQRMSALLPTGDKDYRKTYDEVFNDSTLKTIYRLFQRKVL